MSFSNVFKACLASLLLVFFFSACTNNNIEDLKPTNNAPCDSTYSFNGVAEIFETNCVFAGCHNPGSSFGDFTQYADLRAKFDAGSLENRVFIIGDMPPSTTPGTPLTDCEKGTIRQWMNDGAPK